MPIDLDAKDTTVVVCFDTVCTQPPVVTISGRRYCYTHAEEIRWEKASGWGEDE